MSALKDKYVNPLTDFGFKKLFGTEPNKALLIDFLNQILPDRKIKDLTYASNEQLGKTEIDRKAIFDLYCIGDNDERFIVEMQKAKQNYFKDRSVFYASFPIQEQAEKGEWDFKLEPVYSVGILDFVFTETKNDENLLHIVELKDQEGKVFYNKLKFIYLELPKFKKEEHELETHFEKWLYVFTKLSMLDNRPAKLKERIFRSLFEAAEVAKFSPEERKAYENSLKYYRDIKNVVDTARDEGIKKGMQEGIEKGVKKRSFEVAKALKKNGVSIKIIMQSTGLTKKEIESL